ncbi:MAG TPA: UDP-N-acetylmuramate dehydrogenase [Ktedonobacteraceae bacterium]|nr:UDP-N-acetylmuramate dehydrogenase [Ktedonobacteraceae bacterium]
MTFDTDKTYTQLYPYFKGHIRRNEPLARHSTFGVGGPADIWISLETPKELIDLVSLSMQNHWPVLLVGNGTNTLFADAGARGIAARIAFDNYEIDDYGDGTALLRAEAGVSWPRLLNNLANLGWAGLEFGPGIPGTLGGSIISNAGAHDRDISEVLEWVEILDVRDSTESKDGMRVPIVRRFMRDELNLTFRNSQFRSGRRVLFDEEGYPIVVHPGLIDPVEIIMQLGVRLHRDDPRRLRSLIEEYKQHRKRTQPPQQSLGSVFRNPPGDFAGRLIEEAGVKGLVHGKAQISERHANFIVNLGGASAADAVALIVEARKCVLAQLGVDLGLEVELRGDWGES